MLKTGVKGSDCYETTGKDLLDLYAMLNRGLSPDVIETSLKKIFSSGSEEEKIDACVLAFQTRDIRGGKGERDLFYHMALAIGPEIMERCIDLVPEYGYWEDVNRLGQHDVRLEPACVKLTLDQFLKDEAALEQYNAAVMLSDGAPLAKPKLSLVSRHMPREHNKKPADVHTAKRLAYALSPGNPKALAIYRKRLSAVTRALDVAEVHFAGKDWASLNPATMPGRCLKTHIKGLLNQPVSGKHGRKVVLADRDRIVCAAKFSRHLALAAEGKAKVKGANVVFPHELVRTVLKHLSVPVQRRVLRKHSYDSEYEDDGYESDDRYPHQYSNRLSQEELDGLEAQWRSIVDPIKASGCFGKWLAMCDFSGSMAGDPMCVSMALGLIIAECNIGVFKDTILTFDSTPTLKKFQSQGLVARVEEVRHLAQGTSTNFQAAYNLVLKAMIDNGVPAGAEPTELVVLTDMGFDAACGFGHGHRHAVKTAAHETHMQIARRAFEKQGEALGVKWLPPRIVCWNLRAEYKDFQATAAEEGVIQVSGWSPSMLKVLTSRGLEAFTPYAMLRAVLDDPRYDPVRERVSDFLDPMPPLVSCFY
jgi:hypothetical protein